MLTLADEPAPFPSDVQGMPIEVTVIVMAAIALAVVVSAFGLGWHLRGYTKDCPTCVARAAAEQLRYEQLRERDMAAVTAGPHRAYDAAAHQIVLATRPPVEPMPGAHRETGRTR